MSVPIITECCYTCNSCKINSKICTLSNKVIHNIFKDKCKSYSKRNIIKCEICGKYVVNLESHISNMHHLTKSEYNIKTQLETTKSLHLKERSLF